MSVIDLQIASLKQKIKLEALTGKLGDSPFIPTENFLNSEVKKRLSEPGTPLSEYSAINRNSKSDPDAFSNAIRNFIFDLKTLKQDIKNQRQDIQKYFDTSRAEYDNAYRALLGIIKTSNSIKSGIPEEELTYTVFDGFIDKSKIDNNNLSIDTEACAVSLGNTKNDAVDLSHYRKVNNPKITITDGVDSVQYRRHLPGCSFSNLFNGNEMDNWVFEVRMHRDSTIEFYFDIQVHPKGLPIPINKVEITSVAVAGYDNSERGEVISTSEEDRNEIGNHGSVALEWKGPETNGEWRSVPDSIRKIQKKTEWLINWGDLKGEVTNLRFRLRKNVPDVEKTYRFSLSEIALFRSDFLLVGELYSKPLKMEAYSSETPAVMTAALSTDSDVPEGTSIRYYIGLDEPVSGYFADENGLALDSNSPNINQFVPDPSSYVFASDLKNLYSINGASEYQDWEPTWFEFTPSDQAREGVPTFVEFDNYIFHKDTEMSALGIWGDENTEAVPTGIAYQTDDYRWGETKNNGFWRPDVGTWPGGYYSDSGNYPSRELSTSGVLYASGEPSVADFTTFGKDFYKMYVIKDNTDVVPGSLKLSIRDNQAQSDNFAHMWQYTTRDSFKWTERTAYSDKNTDNMTVISSGSQQVSINVHADGLIEYGSVKDFKHKGSRLPYEQNYDYYVAYSGSQFDIDISPITYSEQQAGTLQRAWEVTYTYKQELPEQNSWSTFLYNKTDHDVVLPLNEQYKYNMDASGNISGQLDGFKIDYLDASISTPRLPNTTTELSLKPGWNKIYAFATENGTTANLINNIIDKGAATWEELTSYVSPGMMEMDFTELTRMTSPDVYSLFTTIEDSSGDKWVVVPSMKHSNIENEDLEFVDPTDPYYIFRNDAYMLQNVYHVEYKEAKDIRKNRVLMKIVMRSNKEGVTPVLRNYMVLLNKNSLRVSKPSDVLDQGSIGAPYAV